MLRTRLLTAAVLIPIVACCIYLGGISFLVLVVLLLTLAEMEFCQLVARDGFRPVLAFGLGMVWLLLLDAQFPALKLQQPGMALILLGSLAWQLFHRGGSPVADWALTLTGGLYMGLCGACLIALRGMQPDGMWWTLTVVPAIMAADSGAYLVGRAWGRHRLAPALSPGKTWEGYAAGVIAGGLITALLASFWHTRAGAGTVVSGVHGLVLGLLIATFAPLGDLAVSMIKRQVGAKDSGKIIPGHGGALDRVDSVLWAAVIGYYYVQIFTPMVLGR
ncbi:MAG TPA: phosphatidate cytidylyltransferase [Anaerolineae bacterium]|nr:phosphatidate cytidylyltransferase [Anaerolineae bacterium]